MVSISDFIKGHDTEGTVRKAIAECLAGNMDSETALDVLSEALVTTVKDYLYDDGSNIERLVKSKIRETLESYLTPPPDQE